jgi:c-di-GMP-binding flagellar brake protein YcgR
MDNLLKDHRCPGKASPMEQERRRSPRFPFTASAQVQAESAGSQLAARITDISASGCYVDTINPLPGGTPVRVKIFNEAKSFEAAATVVCSHAHLGMGLRFSEIPPNSLSVLQGWLPAAV